MFIKIEKTKTTKGPLGAPVFTVTGYSITIPSTKRKIKWEIRQFNDAPPIWKVTLFIFFILATVASGAICVAETDEAIKKWFFISFVFCITAVVAFIGHTINES